MSRPTREELEALIKVKSCGVFCYRETPELEFLFMEHANRLDLPKGHVEEGEDEMACAVRELEEETEIPPGAVEVVEGFRFTNVYYPRYSRFGGKRVEKTLVMFLARLVDEQQIRPSEHRGHRWIAATSELPPGGRVHRRLVDEAARFLERRFHGDS